MFRCLSFVANFSTFDKTHKNIFFCKVRIFIYHIRNNVCIYDENGVNSV